jgi:hypothetical protein
MTLYAYVFPLNIYIYNNIYIYTYEHETNTVVTSSDPQENQQFLGGFYSYITWICLRTPQKMKHILPKGFPVRSGKSSSANP